MLSIKNTAEYLTSKLPDHKKTIELNSLLQKILNDQSEREQKITNIHNFIAIRRIDAMAKSQKSLLGHSIELDTLVEKVLVCLNLFKSIHEAFLEGRDETNADVEKLVKETEDSALYMRTAYLFCFKTRASVEAILALRTTGIPSLSTMHFLCSLSFASMEKPKYDEKTKKMEGNMDVKNTDVYKNALKEEVEYLTSVLKDLR